MSTVTDSQEPFTIDELIAMRADSLRQIENPVNPDLSQAIADLVCADTLLCEAYSYNFSGDQTGLNRKKVDLCTEIAQYVPKLFKPIMDNEDLATMTINVCTRAAETLYEHPRLKHRLLKLANDIRISQSMEPDFDLENEITYLAKNILRADMGELDRIEDKSMLKKDPIEWTEAFENAIHLAQEKADRELADSPRGMGFCFEYWPTLTRILLEDYGIKWRSPNRMNPRVMFD